MKKFLSLSLVFISFLSLNPLSAQTQTFISDIVIKGTTRIAPETVRAYLTFSKGRTVNYDDINDSLKSLYKTELFSDVTHRLEGSRLVINVTENPIINRIGFEGNKRVKTEKLKPELQVRPRTVYTKAKIVEDVERMLMIYRHNGRYGAKVNPKIVKLPQNRVDLVFEIDEGPVTRVQKVIFIGNDKLSGGSLRNVIKTKESAWFRLLSSDDIYDPYRLEVDKEILREYYLSKGFADFRVNSVVAQLTPDKKAFNITFNLEEGPRYKFGQIVPESLLKELPSQALMSEIDIETGDRFNMTKVNDIVLKLTDLAGSRGFAFVDVKPKTTINPETLTVDVRFSVGEGPKIHIERINIVDNYKTRDHVIRRQFGIAEGDPFNLEKIKEAKRNLQNMGIFEKVDIDHDAGTNPDQAVVTVAIEEKRTSELNFGGGYGDDGIAGRIELKESNFLGNAQEIGASVLFAQRRKEYHLTFTEPHFLDRKLIAGLDLFKEDSSQSKDTSYQLQEHGLTARLGYNLEKDLVQSWDYIFKRSTVGAVDSDAAAYIRAERRNTTTSSIGHRLVYDKRDNRLAPTSGYFFDISQEVAGLGGNTAFFRNITTGGIYYSLADEWVASFIGESGFIQDFDKNKPLQIGDRFFLGGQRMRGFKYGGIGPRDTVSGDPLGGRAYALGTAELSIPLGLPEELGMKGFVFAETGIVSNHGISGSTIANVQARFGRVFPIRDKAKWRLSGGVGLGWKTPIGYIRLDLANPFIRDKQDKRQWTHINFGTRF